MLVYLVRHGEATTEQEDPKRPLTAAGAREVERIARSAIADLDVRPARILHSGKTRARQTAEIWSGLLSMGAEEADALAPNDDPAIWAGRLQDETDDVMLVGHLPNLARLAALLLNEDDDAIDFAAGSFVRLERTMGLEPTTRTVWRK